MEVSFNGLIVRTMVLENKNKNVWTFDGLPILRENIGDKVDQKETLSQIVSNLEKAPKEHLVKLKKISFPTHICDTFEGGTYDYQTRSINIWNLEYLNEFLSNGIGYHVFSHILPKNLKQKLIKRYPYYEGSFSPKEVFSTEYGNYLAYRMFPFKDKHPEIRSFIEKLDKSRP